MGPSSVSSLQYDSNMSAAVLLRLQPGEGDASASAWSLHRVEAGEPESTLRRRQVATAVKPAGGAKASPGQLPVAPLRWFAGSLPPPSLRAAQQHFWRALECAVDAANESAALASIPVPPSNKTHVEETVDAATVTESSAPASESFGGQVDELMAAVDSKCKLAESDAQKEEPADDASENSAA